MPHHSSFYYDDSRLTIHTEASTNLHTSKVFYTTNPQNQVVAHAKDTTKYFSPALAGFTREPHQGKGWFWKKSIPASEEGWFSYIRGFVRPAKKGEAREILIPEFIMPSEDHFEFDSLERKLILQPPKAPKGKDGAAPDAAAQEKYMSLVKDAKAAKDFLERLDKENGTEHKRAGCACWKCMDVEQRFGHQHA